MTNNDYSAKGLPGVNYTNFIIFKVSILINTYKINKLLDSEFFVKCCKTKVQ